MNLNSSAEQPPTDHSEKLRYFWDEFPHCNRIGRPDDGLLGRTYFICIAFTSAKRRHMWTHNNRRFHLKHNFNIHFRSKGLFLPSLACEPMRSPKHIVANVVDDWLTEMVSNVLSLTDDGFQFSSGTKKGTTRTYNEWADENRALYLNVFLLTERNRWPWIEDEDTVP